MELAVGSMPRETVSSEGVRPFRGLTFSRRCKVMDLLQSFQNIVYRLAAIGELPVRKIAALGVTRGMILSNLSARTTQGWNLWGNACAQRR